MNNLLMTSCRGGQAMVRSERTSGEWFTEAERCYVERHQGCAWCGGSYRVFRRQRRALAGIGDQEAARAAKGRLGMAQQALVSIVPRTEAVRVSIKLRKYRIELAEPLVDQRELVAAARPRRPPRRRACAARWS